MYRGERVECSTSSGTNQKLVGGRMSNIARFTSLALAALVALACFSVPPTADAQVEGNPPAVVLTPAIQGSSRGLPEEPGVDRSRYHHIPLLWAEGCRFEKYSPEQEIIERRKGTSKAFDNGDGTETAIIGIAPIHYQDEEGLWQEIGTEIVPNSSGKHSAFEHAVVENRHQVYLDGENSGGYLVEVDGGEILFGTESVIHLEADDGTILATVPRASVPGIVESSTLRYPGSYPQLAAAEELLIQRRVVKHTIVLEERPALFDAHPAARNFVLREWVQLPPGWTVVLGLNPDEVASGNSASQLQIVDQEGRHKASIPTPVFMEKEPRADQAAGPEGERIPGQIEKGQGTYRVQPSPGGVFIDTVVPMEWLRNEDRRFPVLIDPTIEVLVPESTDFAGFIADNGNWCSTGWPNDGDPVWASGGQIGAASPDDQQRAWFRFLVNMIPQSSVIIDTDLTIQFASSNWPYLNFTAISNTNNISCPLRYYEIGTGVYATHNCPSGTTTGNVTTDLGASADADLQDSLAYGAFGIGIHEFGLNSLYSAEIYSWGSWNWQEPYIEVCYTPPSVTRVAWVATPNDSNNIFDVDACDTVYCRVEAVGYTEVNVEVHQDDCNACCDSIVVAEFPVQIDLATGFGTAQWEAVWNNAAQDYFLRVEDTQGTYLACSCGVCDLDVNDTNPPSCPSLQSPGDGATFPWNPNLQINFSWSLNPGPGCASGFAQYRFRLSRNADLSAPLQEFDTTNTSAAFAGLGPGDWYWGVNAQDDAGNWNWASCGSRLFSLDVVDAGIQLDSVMPDPVSAGCTLLISYSVTNTGNTDHEFDIGCTITGPNNFLVNLPAPMITLNAGDTSSGEIPFPIPPAPQIGIWQATVAVWESQAGAGVNLDSSQAPFQVQAAMTTATIAISS
ncbi:MAG TPA: hypothetical protein EYN40_01825, partial [Planctomycetes bacterium]|nr:hypothetical protein [Planctomycetota bacterium]